MEYMSYGASEIKEKEVKVKTTVLELSLDPRYTMFDIPAAFREIIQNAMDEHDLGNRMEILRGSKIRGKLPEGHVDPISIVNYGSTMGRECLLMGGTSKREVNRKCPSCGHSDHNDADRSSCWNCCEELPKPRGKHGEGFKVAALVFLRNGYTVRVRTNTETWMFFTENSKNFGGAELMKVKVSPATPVEFIAFEIGGVDEQTWKEATSMCLAINPPKAHESVKVGEHDLILTSDAFRGHIFSQGLHVTQVDSLHYGYDLYNLKLDRDRKSADYYSQKECIARVLAKAVNENALSVEDIMSLPDNCDEQSALDYEYQYMSTPDSFAEKMAEEFIKKYGEEAVAVASQAEAMQAGQLGFYGVTVPRGIRSIINSKLGDFSKKAKKRELDESKIYSQDELSEVERNNLDWATAALNLVEDWLTPGLVSVVDFFGDRVLGTYRGTDDHINLNKSILANRQSLMEVYIHEVAHKYGPDGSDSHRRGIERIAATLISTFVN